MDVWMYIILRISLYTCMILYGLYGCISYCVYHTMILYGLYGCICISYYDTVWTVWMYVILRKSKSFKSSRIWHIRRHVSDIYVVAYLIYTKSSRIWYSLSHHLSDIYVVKIVTRVVMIASTTRSSHIRAFYVYHMLRVFMCTRCVYTRIHIVNAQIHTGFCIHI